MIKLNNVSFSYEDKQVIRDFNLEINKNDRICFYGPSGCGKTTLLRIILGLEKVKDGKVIMDKHLKPAVVFQENRLLPFKTVLENITIFGADEKIAHENLDSLGIIDSKDLKPNELSGGMKRRVALARALSINFDYLILDEAFNGLDKENIIDAVNLINKTCVDKPIILVTHSTEDIELLNAKIVNL